MAVLCAASCVRSVFAVNHLTRIPRGHRGRTPGSSDTERVRLETATGPKNGYAQASEDTQLRLPVKRDITDDP